MRNSLNIFCLFGLLVSPVFAVPTTSHQVQKGSFKVERVRNPYYVGNQSHNGPRGLYKALVKYGRRSPPGLLDFLNTRAVEDKRASGADKITAIVANYPNNDDSVFLSPVTIGGQSFYMDLDTGSSTLWVRNTQLLDKSLLPDGAVLFDQSMSPTFEPVEQATLKVTYMDGSGAVGVVGKDNVEIGGATATRQVIGLPTALSGDLYEDVHYSGIVGLAFNSNTEPLQKTFFNSIAPQLKKKLFTADLRHNEAGSYEFGAIDRTKYTGTIQYAPIHRTDGMWMFSSTKFVIKGTSYSSSINTAVADTGSALLLVSENIVDAYYSNVEHITILEDTEARIFPCNSNLPDIKVSVGDKFATVRGATLNSGPLYEGSDKCFGGLQVLEGGSNPADSHMVFGNTFFLDNFVVFDHDEKRIGFAPHAY